MKFETIMCPLCREKIEVNVANDQTVTRIEECYSKQTLRYNSLNEEGKGTIDCKHCSKRLEYKTRK